MTVKVPNGVYSNEKQNIKRAEGNFNYRMGKAGDCFIRIYWMRYQRKFPLSTRVTRSELYSDIYIYLYIHNFVDLYRQGLSKRKSPRLIQLISVPLLALLLRGNRSEDIPPIIPTCLVT